MDSMLGGRGEVILVHLLSSVRDWQRNRVIKGITASRNSRRSSLPLARTSLCAGCLGPHPHRVAGSRRGRRLGQASPQGSLVATTGTPSRTFHNPHLIERRGICVHSHSGHWRSKFLLVVHSSPRSCKSVISTHIFKKVSKSDLFGSFQPFRTVGNPLVPQRLLVKQHFSHGLQNGVRTSRGPCNVFALRPSAHRGL